MSDAHWPIVLTTESPASFLAAMTVRAAGVLGGSGSNAESFITGGGIVWYGPYSLRYLDPPGGRDDAGSVLGYNASGGLDVFGTNATSVCDLRGPFTTLTIGGGAFSGGEVTIAWSGRTFFVSVMGTVSVLPVPSGMISLITTNTGVKPLAGRNCGCDR